MDGVHVVGMHLPEPLPCREGAPELSERKAAIGAWILQAYSRIVDPNLTYDDLKTLDKKLKLPSGWRYRVKVLDQDLGVDAIDGVVRIVQDNLQGTYNACFETDNKKNCSYKR
jgi:hypothetical protein